MKRKILILALALSSAVWAGDFEDGKVAYEQGNYSLAIDRFKKSANQGDAEAQFALGKMYAAGRGVTQNITEAVRLFKLAAHQGHIEAQYYIGGLAHTVQKYDDAIHWYTLAAKQGFAEAQSALGFIYGEGEYKNLLVAYMWLNISVANKETGENTISLRNLIEAQLNPDQQLLGKQMAKACLDSCYKKCT
jgi:TPR repeat protein